MPFLLFTKITAETGNYVNSALIECVVTSSHPDLHKPRLPFGFNLAYDRVVAKHWLFGIGASYVETTIGSMKCWGDADEFLFPLSTGFIFGNDKIKAESLIGGSLVFYQIRGYDFQKAGTISKNGYGIFPHVSIGLKYYPNQSHFIVVSRLSCIRHEYTGIGLLLILSAGVGYSF